MHGPGTATYRGLRGLWRLFDYVDTVILGHANTRILPDVADDARQADAVDVVSRLAAKINGAHKWS